MRGQVSQRICYSGVIHFGVLHTGVGSSLAMTCNTVVGRLGVPWDALSTDCPRARPAYCAPIHLFCGGCNIASRWGNGDSAACRRGAPCVYERELSTPRAVVQPGMRSLWAALRQQNEDDSLDTAVR